MMALPSLSLCPILLSFGAEPHQSLLQGSTSVYANWYLRYSGNLFFFHLFGWECYSLILATLLPRLSVVLQATPTLPCVLFSDWKMLLMLLAVGEACHCPFPAPFCLLLHFGVVPPVGILGRSTVHL